jgi:hypothetical protein
MIMSKKDSEVFYQSVINGSYDPRLKESIKNIKAACDEIEQYGGYISVGRVGKICKENYRGPATQSIRNKPETLKRYVNLRQAEQVLPKKTEHDNVKMKISDPKIRVYVLQLEERLDSCLKQIQGLKKLFSQLAPIEIDSIIAQAFSSGSLIDTEFLQLYKRETFDQAGKIKLSELSRQALEKITNEEHLRLCGLRLYKGRVLTATNYKFLDGDEFSALLELLKIEE